MFEHSLYKLARALDHQEEVRGRFVEYIGEGHIALEARTEGKDMQFMSAVVKEKPSQYISLAIGDTFHCLRCSLDYLTSELLRRKGKNVRVTFPMHETEMNLVNLMENGVLGKEFPELISMIVSDLRPFKHGDRTLWNIGHFDNTDKHNLILPTVSVSRIVGASFHTAHTIAIHSTLEIGLGNRIEGYLSQSPEPFVIDDPGIAQAALLFPEGKALSHADVILALKDMCQLTLEAINLFGKTYDPDWEPKTIQYNEPGT